MSYVIMQRGTEQFPMYAFEDGPKNWSWTSALHRAAVFPEVTAAIKAAEGPRFHGLYIALCSFVEGIVKVLENHEVDAAHMAELGMLPRIDLQESTTMRDPLYVIREVQYRLTAVAPARKPLYLETCTGTDLTTVDDPTKAKSFTGEQAAVEFILENDLSHSWTAVPMPSSAPSPSTVRHVRQVLANELGLSREAVETMIGTVVEKHLERIRVRDIIEHAVHRTLNNMVKESGWDHDKLRDIVKEAAMTAVRDRMEFTVSVKEASLRQPG